MQSLSLHTSCVLCISLLFIYCDQVTTGNSEHEGVIRERRESPTRYPDPVNEFLITQKGQVIVAVALGVSGYLCCVILPCCLGACSIFLLHCMNLVEYPSTPVQKKRDKTTYAKTEKPETIEEKTPNKVIDHPQSMYTTQDPNPATNSEHFYFPMQTQSLYPLLPYQLSYTLQGAQDNSLHFTNPIYNSTQQCQIDTYYNVAPMEPNYENCNY